MNDLSNFNEILKNVIYDNKFMIISKVTKKQGFTLFIENREYIFWKNQTGNQIDPQSS